MFTGFEDAMIDFFWSIRFNNHRPWFQEHKATYVEKIYEPMKALAKEVYDGVVRECDFQGAWKCSRIYRDARRPHKDGPYRDNIWFVLAQRERWSGAPTFYAEITAEGIAYGFGAYCPSPEFMKNVRAKMAANPAQMERLISDFEKDGKYTLMGEMYKRPKGHISEKIDPWYNRKNLGFSAFEPWDDRLMSDALAPYLVERFKVLMPLYQWCWQCMPEE